MANNLQKTDFHRLVIRVIGKEDSQSLALLQIKPPFELGLSTNIYPACFANMADSISFNGADLYVVGYGRNPFNLESI